MGMLGVGDDLARSWTPALYMGMGRHAMYGYPQDWDEQEKDATVKRLREKFVKDELPRFMGYISAAIEENGGFVAGARPTVADCALYAQVSYFRRGAASHVPKACLDDH